MESGKLVPDEVVVGIIRERLKQADCAKGYILDGFPRTEAQAEALEKMLETGDHRIDAVINFSIDEKELMARMTGRRLCQKCGKGYHLLFHPPAKKEICDQCGVKLYQRNDDREETISQRLKVYRDQTKPLIAYYAGKGLLKDVDGRGEMNEVFKRIGNALGIN